MEEGISKPSEDPLLVQQRERQEFDFKFSLKSFNVRVVKILWELNLQFGRTPDNLHDIAMKGEFIYGNVMSDPMLSRIKPCGRMELFRADMRSMYENALRSEEQALVTNGNGHVNGNGSSSHKYPGRKTHNGYKRT